MKPKKELGQNFLRDESVVESLVEASNPQPTDTYLEIGPGRGAVTKSLAPKVKKVIAVEIDSKLTAGLKKHFQEQPNVVMVDQDIIKFLDAPRYHDIYHSNKIIGSIPYQITSPLLHKLAEISTKKKIESIVFLIQKEVARKITAKPPRSSYLAIFVQSYFDVQLVRNVSRESFYPIPKVDGTIIKLVPEKGAHPDPKAWSTFLHQGFKHPRKMLKKVFDEKILKETRADPNQRPQELSLKQWLKLRESYEKSRI